MRAIAPLLIAALSACGGADYEPQRRRAPLDTWLALDTAVPDDDTDPDTEPDVDTEADTEPDVDTEADTDPVVVETTVCYLGPNRAGTECLPTVAPTNLPAAYTYPPALNGSAQYRAPERYLDLAAVAPTTPIAPNFVLSEIAEESKGRYGVVQPHAVASLQSVRDALGRLRVNSGYRSPDYNAGVGGVSSSRHQYGDAFDLDPLDSTLSALDASCDANGAGYVGVYTTHIHCDWRNDAVDTVFYGPARRAAAPLVPHELNAHIAWRGGVLTAPAEGWDEGEPLREWTSVAADGSAIETVTATEYVPHADAVAVDVWVGRRLSRRMVLEP